MFDVQPMIDIPGYEIKWNEDYRLWWPSDESEPQYKYMLARVTDVDVAISHVRTKGIVVQAGGYIGMWPARLAKTFERVYTFEPVPHLFECLKRNTAHLPLVRPYNAALSDHMGDVEMNYKRGGCSRVVEGGRERVKTLTVDSLALSRCDALILDVERHEMEILDGAQDTILRFHPVIMLETKEDTLPIYMEKLVKLGYERAAKVHADVIWTHV